MLWIGLHLPALPLETFAASLPAEARAEPLALLDDLRVVQASAAAQHLGIRPGMRRATALALAPQLRIGQADAQRDAQALAGVAHAALAFTPAVTLAPPDRSLVLMEVQASLRCFGGRERLLQRLRAAFAPLGHRVCIASAPTAQAADWLARSIGLHGDATAAAPEPLHCADQAALRRRLADLPVHLLGPGRQHWDALQGMGLCSVGDLLRLPRAGLARRFGAALLDELDRALGAAPDPRCRVVPPAVFESRLELWERADTSSQLVHGAGVLLQRLVAWAQAQQARVRRCTLSLRHESRQRGAAQPPTRLEIALAEPSCDAAHLQLLLREHLARMQLAAPAFELHLQCSDIVHAAPPNGQLFAAPAGESEGLLRLIERLQARLGAQQVQRLARIEDHRPERAGAALPVAAGDAAARRAPPRGTPRTSRPAWLLPEPEPLAERRDLPLLDGAPLQLLCGPERIETGWWDGAPAARDYFIAQAADGSLVWVFRGRLPLSAAQQVQGWYLQGRFA